MALQHSKSLEATTVNPEARFLRSRRTLFSQSVHTMFDNWTAKRGKSRVTLSLNQVQWVTSNLKGFYASRPSGRMWPCIWNPGKIGGFEPLADNLPNQMHHVDGGGTVLKRPIFYLKDQESRLSAYWRKAFERVIAPPVTLSKPLEEARNLFWEGSHFSAFFPQVSYLHAPSP